MLPFDEWKNPAEKTPVLKSRKQPRRYTIRKPKYLVIAIFLIIQSYCSCTDKCKLTVWRKQRTQYEGATSINL